MGRFLPAAQDDRVPSFQRERHRVHRHIGTRLVDNPHHPQRNSHLADVHAVRMLPFRKRFVNGIRQGRHIAYTRSHRNHTIIRQQQPVTHRPLQAARLQILLIGLNDFLE